MNKISKKIFASIFLCISFSVFSQNSELENEDNIIENPDFFAEETKQTQNQEQEIQTHITISHSSEILTLNPHLSSYSSEAQILINIYEGLFSYNPKTCEPDFAIAKDYKISRDKKRWTFILRDDAKFCDGKTITSNDVKNSWINLLKNKNAPYSSLFDIIEGAKEFRTGKSTSQEVSIYTPDEKTLSVHLVSPASYLPRLLCMPAFSVVSETPGIFSGPFYISMFTPTELELLKNPHYYDSENIKLQSASFLLTENAEDNSFFFNTALSEWITGSVNYSKIIDENSKHISVQFGTEYLSFKIYDETDSDKTSCFNIWNKKEFRQALLESCPWDKMRENVFVKASTFVYPVKNYPQVQGYDYTDLIQGKRLMSEARKKYNIPEEQNLNLSIALSEFQEEKAQILKDAWKELGVDVNFIQTSNLSQITSSNADMFFYSWIGDFTDPLTFLELYKKDSSLNISGWSNAEFEEKLKEANLYTDENREKLLSEAEQILLDDAMILPIQHPVSLNIINLNKVKGWYINPFNIHPLKSVYIQKIPKTYPGLVKK